MPPPLGMVPPLAVSRVSLALCVLGSVAAVNIDVDGNSSGAVTAKGVKAAEACDTVVTS